MTTYLQQLKELSSKQYNLWKECENKIDKLISEYGNEKINKYDFLKINDFHFNYSFVFDDIYQKDNTIYLLELFFMFEENNKNNYEIRNHFPSYFDIQNFIENHTIHNKNGYSGQIIFKEDLNDNDCDPDYVYFTDFDKLSNYINSFNEIFSIFDNFISEIETYLQNLSILTISNSKPYKINSNGGVRQDLLLKTSLNLYKIDILSESHEKQSYGKLYVKDDCGWTLLKNINPKRDYCIDVSYQDKIKKDVFNVIIEDFTDIITSVDEIV